MNRPATRENSVVDTVTGIRQSALRLEIFCLEGNWSTDLTYSGSIRPVLEVLRNLDYVDQNHAPPIYRDACTRHEFEVLISRWAKDYGDYRVAYIASHGAPGIISLDHGESIDLEDLAALLEGKCEGRILFFGGCATLGVSRQRVAAFLKRTRARAICGYSKPVDVLDAVAFEIMFFGTLARRAVTSSRIGDGLTEFARSRQYRAVAPGLGFWIHDSRSTKSRTSVAKASSKSL
jgi:hypothetical protein